MKKIIRRLIDNKSSFRIKMTIMVIALLLFFITAITVQAYSFTKKALIEKTHDYLKSIAESSYVTVERTVKDIEGVTLSIIGDSTIQSQLYAILADKSLSEYDIYQRNQSIRGQLSNYALLRPEITSIYVVDTSQMAYYYSKGSDIFYNSILDHEKDIFDQDGKVVWFQANYDGACVFCSRSINHLTTLESLGSVSVTIGESYFDTLYSKLAIPASGQVYILDSEYRIMSSHDKSAIGSIVNEKYHKILSSKSSRYDTIDNEYSVYISEPLSNGWRVMMAIPSSYYLEGISDVTRVFLLSSIVLTIIAAILAFMMTERLTRPIYSLATAIKAFGSGDFNAKSDLESNDEIGMLCKTFNNMVEDMNELYNTVYEQKIMRKNAEIKLLQMQINPHFLYNTLDAINWAARVQGADTVGDMAFSLGALMRYSLSPGDFTTLEKEINGLEHYLDIHRFRYSDKLVSEIDIDNLLYQIYIPKLLIQPIVENAIVHGLEKKVGSGMVRISAFLDDKDDFFIEVCDDGVGISSEIQRSILCREGKAGLTRTHIGMSNVNQRIKLHYGEGYGLNIDSVIGEGTRITLHLKALRNMPG